MWSSHRIPIARNQLPVATAIEGCPDLTILSLLSIPWDAVTGLQHRNNPIRVRWSYRDGNLSDGKFRKSDPIARPIQLLPRVTTVS